MITAMPKNGPPPGTPEYDAYHAPVVWTDDDVALLIDWGWIMFAMVLQFLEVKCQQ